MRIYFLDNSFPTVVDSVIGMVVCIRHRDQYMKVRSSSVDGTVRTTLEFLDDPGRRTQMGWRTPHAMD